jgi:hypothetical protein
VSILAKGTGLAGGAASSSSPAVRPKAAPADVYFSVDIETDGPIPGPYSLLSFAIVEAGSLAEGRFSRPKGEPASLYLELQPISAEFQVEALQVNGLDRERLVREGREPAEAMRQAAEWIASRAGHGEPVLVAYPLSFDWSWLYWYFVRFTGGSPFRHSRCFDMKTALAVKGKRGIAESGHRNLPAKLRSDRPHTHHALDDARAQAEVFANLMEWDGA